MHSREGAIPMPASDEPVSPEATKHATITTDCLVCGRTQHRYFLKDVPDRLGVVASKFTYLQCSKCAFVSLYPRPSVAETATFYPASFWRTKEKGGQKSALKRFETWYRNRLMNMDFKTLRRYFMPGVRHLDVGCSTGDFMLVCQAHGAISTGIELSESAAKYCVEERKLDVLAGDLVTFDFRDEKFDVITYNAVLEHLANPMEHLAKCRQLLKPDGKLILLGLPNIRSVGFRVAKDHWLALDCPRHVQQFDEESLVAFLARAGFSVTQMSSRSPRFNSSSLIASIVPTLHRHKIDQFEAMTGRNPIVRKAMLLALFEGLRPLDWFVSSFGWGEHLSCVAVPDRGPPRRAAEK
jgi:SAM-dependent methyltransferase